MSPPLILKTTMVLKRVSGRVPDTKEDDVVKLASEEKRPKISVQLIVPSSLKPSSVLGVVDPVKELMKHVLKDIEETTTGRLAKLLMIMFVN